MRPAEAVETANVMHQVIRGTRLYNQRARKGECAKFSAEVLLAKRQAWAPAVLVALEQDQPVGFCVSEIQDEVIWIYWLGVSPGHRGKGLAGRLLRRLESEARKAGISKIWCDSRVQNTPIRLLLTSLGYETLCTIKNHWYGQDFMLWQKFLR